MTRDELVQLLVDSYVKGANDALASFSEACRGLTMTLVPIKAIEDYSKTFNETKSKEIFEIYKKEIEGKIP